MPRMWRQRARTHGWKLVVLAACIVVPLVLDVPRPVKAAAGVVAIALAIAEFVVRRRKRRAQAAESPSVST